eukprot:scaffold100396_cov37-Phaeocystis_antarctica.AAC.2
MTAARPITTACRCRVCMAAATCSPSMATYAPSPTPARRRRRRTPRGSAKSACRSLAGAGRATRWGSARQARPCSATCAALAGRRAATTTT